MITVQRELAPGDPVAVRTGRLVVQDCLAVAAGPAAVDDAVLAVSELLTNAVCVARDCIRLVVEITDRTVRVEVFDDGPGTPRVGISSTDRTGGRGLAIVETVATSWGVRADPPGKWVWATFPYSQADAYAAPQASRVAVAS